MIVLCEFGKITDDEAIKLCFKAFNGKCQFIEGLNAKVIGFLME